MKRLLALCMLVAACQWSDVVRPPVKIAAMVTDSTTALTEATYTKPAYLTKFVMAPFTVGTSKDTVQRIVGNPGATIPTLGGTWPKDARHHYAKDQPWNSDGTLLKLDTPAIILDGTTYAPRYAVPSAAYDYRWNTAPGRATEIWTVTSDGSTFETIDVTTGAVTFNNLSWLGDVGPNDLLPLSPCSLVAGLGSGEGNLSQGGKWFAWNGPRNTGCPFQGNYIGVIDALATRASYAAGTPQKLGWEWIALPDTLTTVDWTSVSPSGKYVVVHYTSNATEVFHVQQDSTGGWQNYGALTIQHQPQSWPGQVGDTSKGFIYSLGHADMLLNPFDNNEDYICGQEHASPSNHGHNITSTSGNTVSAVGYLVCVRLRDNKVITLSRPFPGGVTEAYIDHVSGRATGRAGWVYASTWNDVSGRAYIDEVDAYALDGVGHMERIAHLHSNYSNPPTCTGNLCYRSEPHPVPDLLGKRVLWASNWMNFCGTGCGARDTTQAYVVGPYRD